MKLLLCISIFVGVGLATCQADEITLEPSKDNTIYEDSNNLSNGSGIFLFSGATANRNNDRPRRALLEFDVSSLPAGATVTSASLEMTVTKIPFGQVTNDFGLHRLTAEFGEGASDAPGQEGRGTSASPGDATWSDSVLGTAWGSPGGDFVSQPSAVTSVGALGKYTWDSTPMLVSDIQDWLADPESNFGWILIGDESTSKTAKRFGSREGAAANRPMLTIEFDVVSVLPGDFNEDQIVDAADISLLCGGISSGDAGFDLNGDAVVDSADLTLLVEELIGTFAGDANLNGEVAFNDFLTLSDNFGQDGDWLAGDFDCSGTVAFADFLQLADNFGKKAEASAGLASVPEPNSRSLLCFALVLGMAWVRKRHR